MKAYETSATVQDRGEVRVAGVPFAPGTEVDVTISPRVPSQQALTSARDAAAGGDGGLRWEGKVLVHEGVGAGPSVAELRDERLDRLGGGQRG